MSVLRRSSALALAFVLASGCAGSGDDDAAGAGASGGAGTFSAGGEAAAGNAGKAGSSASGSANGGSAGAAAPGPSVPGVVVADNAAGTIDCYPLCMLNTDPAADPEMDDWSWENQRSCVIPGTFTSKNQKCTTGEPLPPPDPRPGVLVVRTTEPECVPICRYATEPTGASSDWSYEDNESCLLASSATAMGKRECTFGVEPDFTPPALTGAKVRDGFYTADGKLYDAYGGEFVMRGVNNAHAWFDGYGNYLAWFALDDIAAFGTNTIRVVWETDASPALLADVLHRIVELEMVPMVELHDVTGNVDPGKFLETAAYWTRADVVLVLNEFREYLLINIANEWSGRDADYVTSYQTAIASLRNAGISHTLVIDASGYGQNAASLFDNAEALFASDPERNLLFSLHMYDLYADPERVGEVLSQAVAAKLPLVVGEFGHELTGTKVAWEEIMSQCQTLGIGFIAWSWMGNNADTAHLDMAEDWEGPLTDWGHDVMDGPNGITETARKASIFE